LVSTIDEGAAISATKFVETGMISSGVLIPSAGWHMNTAEAMRYLHDRGAHIPRFEEIDRLIGFEFPIPAMMTEALPADECLQLWETARQHQPRTRLVPVMIGAEPMIDWFAALDCEEVVHRVHTLRAQGRSTDVLETLEQRAIERFSGQVVSTLRSEMFAVRPAWRVTSERSHEPCNTDAEQFLPFLSEEESLRCILLQCEPADVPLYLGFGGWNDSPAPDEQSAMLARWQARFGVQIGHIGRSGVSLFSTQPPSKIDEYRQLLWETFLYCHNTAFQDDATFSGVRQMLAQPWWSFFWD